MTEKLQAIHIKPEALEQFDFAAEQIYKELEDKVKKDKQDYARALKNLEKQERYIIDNLNNFLHLPNILEQKNQELEDIKNKKSKLEIKKTEIKTTTNLEDFKHYSKKLITHLDQLALQKEEPEIIKLCFDIVFGGRVEYEKINSHTAFFTAMCPDLSQQKNSSEDEFVENKIWLAQHKNFRTNKTHQDMRAFVLYMIDIVSNYQCIIERFLIERGVL